MWEKVLQRVLETLLLTMSKKNHFEKGEMITVSSAVGQNEENDPGRVFFAVDTNFPRRSLAGIRIGKFL